MDSEDAARAESVQGVILGLLVLIVLLVAGSTWALLRLHAQFADPSMMGGVPPPAADAAPPPPGAQTQPGVQPPGGPMRAPDVPLSATTAPAPGPLPLRTPQAPPPGRVTQQDKFEDLLLHDLVNGIIHLLTDAPANLRLSADQQARLRALEPRIRACLLANVRRPDPLDAKVRGALRSDQMAYIRRLRQSQTEVLPDLAPYAKKLKALLTARPAQ